MRNIKIHIEKFCYDSMPPYQIQTTHGYIIEFHSDNNDVVKVSEWNCADKFIYVLSQFIINYIWNLVKFIYTKTISNIFKVLFLQYFLSLQQKIALNGSIAVENNTEKEESLMGIFAKKSELTVREKKGNIRWEELIRIFW